MTAATQARLRSGQKGMTLVEQIMVLVIIATMTSMAFPPLRNLLSRNQLQVAQTDLIAGLQHARETAVSSGRRTLFCPSRDGNSCVDDIRWESGWLLGHDVDGDRQPDNGPLYTSRSHAGKLTIYSTAGRRYVRFRPDGSASGSNITLLICRSGSNVQALSVVVSNSGRIRGAPADDAQGAECTQAQ